MNRELAPGPAEKEGTVERRDGLLKRMSERRKESIRRSLQRPLKMEILRTGYIVGCILLDIILVPIFVIETLGHDRLYITVLFLIPLIFLQYRAHRMLFHLPEKVGEPRSEIE